MSVETIEEAKEKINQWLTENGHQARLIEDENAVFHFEVDYPLGSTKRQRIIQPKELPGLILFLNGVSIAEEHKEDLKKMTEDERDAFYGAVRKDLLFVENSFDMNPDADGIAQQVQFSYEFYLDSLNKTNLYKGLLMNHRALLYIVTVFNDKFGIPPMPEDEGQTCQAGEQTAQ